MDACTAPRPARAQDSAEMDDERQQRVTLEVMSTICDNFCRWSSLGNTCAWIFGRAVTPHVTQPGL